MSNTKTNIINQNKSNTNSKHIIKSFLVCIAIIVIFAFVLHSYCLMFPIDRGIYCFISSRQGEGGMGVIDQHC